MLHNILKKYHEERLILMKILVAVLGLIICSVSWADVVVRKYKSVEEVSREVAVREIKVEQMSPSEGEFPCAFSIVPILEWPSQGCDVWLFRFNLLAGNHRTVKGLDLGVLGNRVDGESAGLQLAGIWNDCGASIGSLGVAVAANYSEYSWDGVQVACVNWTEGEMNGIQLGVVNMAGRDLGLQVGLCNFSGKSIGIQLGVINVSEALSGVQVGLINVNTASSVPVLPFLNIGF